MFKHFYPDRYYRSAYTIPYEKLYERGFRGIIFDIDNTLVQHGAPADESSKALFQKLRRIGFQTILLSNNKEPRVKPFADEVASPYLYDAGKPLSKNYIKAMERMGTGSRQTLLIGDQIFTDIWGANRTGIPTFLVKPIDKKEEIQIILKRIPEKVVLWAYKRNCIKEHKVYLCGKIPE